MTEEVIMELPEPFQDPQNPYENIQNNGNNIINEINQNNIVNVIINNNEESLNKKLNNVKLICLFIMVCLIFVEIILEITSSSDYNRYKNKIEWSQKEIDGDENYDFTSVEVFFISLSSNIISSIILCYTYKDALPCCSIISFIVLFLIKEAIVMSLSSCCESRKEIDCSDYFGDAVNGIIIFNSSFIVINLLLNFEIKYWIK